MVYSIILKSQLEGALRLDAEYYQQEYLEIEKSLHGTNSYKFWRDIKGKFITGPFGSEFNVENYIPDGDYRYVRGKDVKDFFLLDDDNVYIPKEDFERLKKYSLNEGDILISVVGTLGNAAIVDDSVPPAIFSCKSTVYRSEEINNYYLISYLNSLYGRKLLERSVRGAVQTGLNINDLKSLPIFIPSKSEQETIGDFILDAKKTYDNSKSFYSQAENLLLEELGLKNFKEENDLYNVVSLSDVESAHRVDAEYFQKKYENIIAKIKNQNAQPLGKISTSIGHSIQPPYDERGAIAVLAQKHMKQGLVIDTAAFDNYTNEVLIKETDKKFILKEGDVLISSAGKPGLACVWTGDYQSKVIPGSFVTIARLTKKADPLYVGVFLNTTVGRLQFERNYSGSVQQYVYPNKIKEILVPILPKLTQQKIADLVCQSQAARKKAKELLETAKQKVEKLIEE